MQTATCPVCDRGKIPVNLTFTRTLTNSAAPSAEEGRTSTSRTPRTHAPLPL